MNIDKSYRSSSPPIGGLQSARSHKSCLTNKIVDGIRDLRQSVKPGKMTIREMVNEGRRS